MPGSPPGDAETERFDPQALAELPADLALSRLPSGRHGLPPAFVARNQRLRMVAAMLRILPRHGYPSTTIGHVTEEAGVSRAAFYRLFESKEACFLETYDIAREWLCERVERAALAEDEWPAKVLAGASEALRLLADNPELAHLLTVEVVKAGPTARARQQDTLAAFADVLRTGRPAGAKLPAELEQLLIGGALSLVARYVDAGRADCLPEATAEVVHYLLIPYLDSEDSRRIAEAA